MGCDKELSFAEQVDKVARLIEDGIPSVLEWEGFKEALLEISAMRTTLKSYEEMYKKYLSEITFQQKLPEKLMRDGSEGDRFAAIYEVDPLFSNVIAVKFIGKVLIKWGDGTEQVVESGIQVEHAYDFTLLSEELLAANGKKQVLVTAVPVEGSRIQTVLLNLTLVDGRKNSSFREILLEGDAITTLANSFQYAVETTYIELANMKALTSLSASFKGMNSINEVKIGDAPMLTTMAYAFMTTNSIQKFSIGLTPKLTTIVYLFYISSGIQSVTFLGTPLLDKMDRAFRGTTNMLLLSIDTSSVTSATEAFMDSKSIETLNIDMSSMISALNIYKNTTMLRVLNPISIKTSFSITNAKIDKDALLSIFETMKDLSAVAQESITLTGTDGADELDAPSIAELENKNWRVII